MRCPSLDRRHAAIMVALLACLSGAPARAQSAPQSVTFLDTTTAPAMLRTPELGRQAGPLGAIALAMAAVEG